MVKPKPDQKMKLENLRSIVLDIMTDMEIWNDFDTDELRKIRLGVLRINATQRHGVTRWKIGVDVSNLRPSDVDEINIHPHLLDERWSAYAAFVLHHEYIHALGFREHDRQFRFMEKSWPGSKAVKHGSEFTEFLRLKNAKWIWICSSCDKQFPRKKPSRGMYKCRDCNSILKDKKL